jgi:hypothetical protein
MSTYGFITGEDCGIKGGLEVVFIISLLFPSIYFMEMWSFLFILFFKMGNIRAYLC